MSRSAFASSSASVDRLKRPRSSTAGFARARITLALRRVNRRRLFALVLAAAIGTVTFSTVNEAQRRSAALGQTQLVAVARVDATAGSTLSADQLTMIERPLQFVPPRAIGHEAVGAVLIADIVAGEVIVSKRIGSNGSPLAVDERALTIPMPLAPPLLDLGDSVELVGLQAVDGPSGPTVSAVVITSGRVLAVNDEAVTVATPDYAALDVLRFLAAGSVELLTMPHNG